MITENGYSMTVVRLDFNKMPYLGAFALATDDIVLIPSRFGKISESSKEAMGVRVVKTLISKSSLIGALAAGNSNGIIVPDHVDTDEEVLGERLDKKVVRIPGKFTALGNQVLVNDKGGIINPDMPDEAQEKIEEALGVDTKRSTIGSLKNVGASAVATNKGAILHDESNEGEVDIVEEMLDITAGIGTVASGVKYIGTGMVANSIGAWVGENTSGPELGRIERILGFT